MLGHSRLVWLVLSYSVVQAGPKLIAILLLQSTKCGDYHAWLLISFDRPSVGGGGETEDRQGHVHLSYTHPSIQEAETKAWGVWTQPETHNKRKNLVHRENPCSWALLSVSS